MPELPEVQSFASALQQSYAGLVVEGITFHRPDLRFPLPRASLERVFARGARLLSVSRAGKQLLLETTGGKARVSLGMSGAFFPAEAARKRKHEHLTVHFEGDVHLGFEDPRRFGFWVVEGDGVGPALPDAADATDEAALLAVFLSERVRACRRSVKDVIMDQRLVAGVGNIYALEALHRVRIHPGARCDALHVESWSALASVLPPLLRTALEHGGSSISTYRRLHGDQGGFQALHLVYGREGEGCAVAGCEGVIARFVQGGRSSFYCPSCQGNGTSTHAATLEPAKPTTASKPTEATRRQRSKRPAKPSKEAAKPSKGAARRIPSRGHGTQAERRPS